MPVFREAGPEAKERLVRTSKGYQQRQVYRDHLSLLAGINNLFDEDYYARIRGDGIDPAYGRNFYAGLALAF